MINWIPNFIRPGVALLAIGLVAVLVASMAEALIKLIGYALMIAGFAVIVVGLMKRWRRPRFRRRMAH